MPTSRSNEEVEEEYRQLMGPDLGPLFHALYVELTWTHWRWKQYRELFASGESRIELLNSSAPLFFAIVQTVLFEDTLLSIGRLTGPHSSKGKPNLSIERLPPLIPDEELRRTVLQLVASTKDSAVFAKDWRDRHLAHRDLGLVLGSATRPLETATREGVEASLQSLRELMNVIQVAYTQGEVGYELHADVQGAEALLYVIRDGLRLEAERQQRWERGEFHPDDLSPPRGI